MKSNTLKKVLSIVIIAIILAIVVTTCVLAFVKKSLYNPMNEINDNMDNYKIMTIYKDGYHGVYLNIESEDEEKKQVMADIKALSDESTKSSILSSMFQGTGSFEPKILTKDEGNVLTKIAQASGKVCLVYDFADVDQYLMWNGEKYKNSQAKDPNAPVTFRKVYIPISNTEEFDVCTAYLADKDDKSSYQIEFLAHQSEIYDYLVNITWEYVIDRNN